MTLPFFTVGHSTLTLAEFVEGRVEPAKLSEGAVPEAGRVTDPGDGGAAA